MSVQEKTIDLTKVVVCDGVNSYSHDAGYENVESITLIIVNGKLTCEVVFDDGRFLTYLENYIVCYSQ